MKCWYVKPFCKDIHTLLLRVDIWSRNNFSAQLLFDKMMIYFYIFSLDILYYIFVILLLICYHKIA